MVCSKCGKEIKNGARQCRHCGSDVAVSKEIDVEYSDQFLTVPPPIITESHTFISEEDFLKKVRQKEELDQEMWHDLRPKWCFPIWIFAFVLLSILVFVIGDMILPSVVHLDTSKKNTYQNGNAFSSGDWTNDEFMIDGKLYHLNQSFSDLQKDGWFFEDEVEIFSLNPGEKVSTTYDILSYEYPKAKVQVGFVNLRDELREFSKCEIWSIVLDNRDTDHPINFMLPGGIQTGSTESEIYSAYGELNSNQIYRVEDSGYTVYHYTYDYSQYLDLMVYDDGGLLQFSFRHY